MKVLNYVLSSFILLLAIVSAVCSGFLYEKRELLIKGWGRMADTIQTMTKTLDTGSGTNVAPSVTRDALNHEHYDNLDQTLPKPIDLTKKIILQRDNLADQVIKAGRAATMTNAPSKETMTSVETYEQAGDGVIKYITDVKRRYDDTVNMLVATGNKVKTPLNANSLKGTSYKSEYAKFDNRIAAMNARMDSANNGYQRFAQVAGVALTGADLEDKNFSDTANKIYNGINKIKTDLASANNTIKQRDQQIVSLNKTIEGKNNEIAANNQEIKKLTEEIDTLRQVLLAGGVPLDVPLWKKGSKEARRALQGRVIEVDNHYGFIVIDVGTQTTVTQQLGTKQSSVNPEIANETEFIVVRDLDKDNSKYLGRIKLYKISEHNAYARVMTGNNDKERIKPGDFVFLPNDMVEISAAKPLETADNQ